MLAIDDGKNVPAVKSYFFHDKRSNFYNYLKKRINSSFENAFMLKIYLIVHLIAIVSNI